VTFDLKTARGPYQLGLAKDPESIPDATLLTLSLERCDGVEKFALRCRIDTTLVADGNPDEILAKLAHWIERDFEMTREYALKSIRSERKLLELVFNQSHRGPF